MAYTLDDIVKEYLLEIGDSQMNRYARLYQFAVSGIREWNMDMSGTLKFKELEINDNDTCDLPADYLNYTRIGICGADSQIHALGRNDRLCLDRSYDECGNPVKHDPGSYRGYATPVVYNTPEFYASHWRNGQLMGKFFGLGGGNNANGQFRIDNARRQLLLHGINSSVSAILLEYISDIQSIDGDFVVHPFLVQTLKDWMYWKSISRDRNFSLGEKQLAEKVYWNSYRASKNRFNTATVKEWEEAVRFGTLGAPKF